MLSETFIAAASSPPQLTSATTALLKDAGIFVHVFKPQPALRSTFKKSATESSCVTISATHVFAAQAQKAVVHVYNREKGNHEATIPFPERIHSLALACDETVLVLGGVSGSIIFWEICTGRLFSTSQSHLQPVNALAVDLKGNFLLSGSLDSNVHVWSLLDLLSFPPTSAILRDERVQPRCTLSDHRGPITAVVVGHSTSPNNIAISSSDDHTAIVWNYRSSERLRTFLLADSPLCLALDPADRAFYTGYKDGSVQIVSFYTTDSKTSIHDMSNSSTPIQPPSSARYYANPSDSGASDPASNDSVLSISLSYDGTTVITGHASGKINAWSIASSGFSATTITQYTGAPITSLQFQRPDGWPNAPPPRFRNSVIVKPKPHEAFSGPKGQINASYTFSTFFPSAIQKTEYAAPSQQHSDFEEALTSPLFPDDMLAAGIAELASWTPATNAAHAPNGTVSASSNGLEQGEDFVSLAEASTGDSVVLAENAERIAHLEKQVEHLRGLQSKSHDHVRELVNENEALKLREEQARKQRAKRAQKRRVNEGNDEAGASSSSADSAGADSDSEDVEMDGQGGGEDGADRDDAEESGRDHESSGMDELLRDQG